jgi:hypothetical protein
MLYCALSFAAGVAATFVAFFGVAMVVGDIDERPPKLWR